MIIVIISKQFFPEIFIYCAQFYFPSPLVNKTVNNDTIDSTSPRVKRLRSNDRLNENDDPATRIYQSQPQPQLKYELDANSVDTSCSDARRIDFCFSQPALMDDLLLCTQLNSTQGTSQNVFQRLVKRMTRFFVTIKCDETIKRLSAAVEELGYTWKISDLAVVRYKLIYQL